MSHQAFRKRTCTTATANEPPRFAISGRELALWQIPQVSTHSIVNESVWCHGMLTFQGCILYQRPLFLPSVLFCPYQVIAYTGAKGAGSGNDGSSEARGDSTMWWMKNARHLLPVVCAAFLLGCGNSAIDISDSEEDIEEDLYSMVPIGTPKAEVRSALKSRLGLESDDYVSFDYRENDPRWSIPLYEDDSGETHIMYYGEFPRIKTDEQGNGDERRAREVDVRGGGAARLLGV